MFIQTEPTPNPLTLKFIPGRVVMEEGTAFFQNKSEAKNSPLAKKIFEVVEDDYLVIDANGFLKNVILSQGINYIAVGLPPTKEDK